MKKDLAHASTDWNEIEEFVARLVKKILENKIKFDRIYTISRGGLVPARLIADRLNIKQIMIDAETIPPDALFVDDIYDTGETFRRTIQTADEPDSLVYATIFARRGERYPKQLIYAELTKGDEYIVFPWDRFEHGAP